MSNKNQFNYLEDGDLIMELNALKIKEELKCEKITFDNIGYYNLKYLLSRENEFKNNSNNRQN